MFQLLRHHLNPAAKGIVECPLVVIVIRGKGKNSLASAQYLVPVGGVSAGAAFVYRVVVVDFQSPDALCVDKLLWLYPAPDGVIVSYKTSVILQEICQLLGSGGSVPTALPLRRGDNLLMMKVLGGVSFHLLSAQNPVHVVGLDPSGWLTGGDQIGRGLQSRKNQKILPVQESSVVGEPVVFTQT